MHEFFCLFLCSSGVSREGRCKFEWDSGTEKGVITKGVSSLQESLESLNSLVSPENGRILLCFPHAGCSTQSLESLHSPDSLENGDVLKRPLFQRPLFPIARVCSSLKTGPWREGMGLSKLERREWMAL